MNTLTSLSGKYPWVYGQTWDFLHGSYGKETEMVAAQSKWRFTFESRTEMAGINHLEAVRG